MSTREFAEKISGFEYPARELYAFYDEAKELGFLIAYGCSDDLLEIGGLYSNEFDAIGGTKIKIGTKGVNLEAVWCPEEREETSWLIKVDCPHEQFTIMEDGVVFCYGAVIHKDDLNA